MAIINLESPEMLWLIVPVIIGGIYLFKRSTKKSLIISRMIVAILLVIALASPYTLDARVTTSENPDIVLISDETASMELFNEETSTNLYEALTAMTPTTLVRLTGEETALGDAIMQYARGDNQIVMVTDGNNNQGAEIEEALEFADDVGTTVYYVEPDLETNDLSLQLLGEKTVIRNSPTQFEILVEQASAEESNFRYEVDIIDEEGNEKTVVNPKYRTIRKNLQRYTDTFTHTFENYGAYTVVARITPSTEDRDAINNVYYKTVFVVPQPKISLITAQESSNFKYNLDSLYDVQLNDKISDIENIDEQKAIVLDNIHASSIEQEEVEILREYLTNGGGLYVVGGDAAFDRANYLNSSIESLLPVTS